MGCQQVSAGVSVQAFAVLEALCGVRPRWAHRHRQQLGVVPGVTWLVHVESVLQQSLSVEGGLIWRDKRREPSRRSR